jgi:hypothetical protein
MHLEYLYIEEYILISLISVILLGLIPSLVESEAFVQAFSPGSTLEPGLKAFRRRGPKCPLKTPPL